MQEKSAADPVGLAAIVQDAIDCAAACGDDATARELSDILADIMVTANAPGALPASAGRTATRSR